MEGISKERLPQIMDKISDLCDNEDKANYYDIEKLLIKECTELNPWLPIDARKVLEETGRELALTVTIEGYLYGYINKDGVARYKILREVKE